MAKASKSCELNQDMQNVEYYLVAGQRASTKGAIKLTRRNLVDSILVSLRKKEGDDNGNG